MRPLPLVAIAVATSVTTVGCAGQPPRPPLPPAAASIHVTMREYHFDVKRRLPAGRVVFRVQNTGTSEHQLVLLSVPEDFPPIDQQLRSSVRQAVAPVFGLRPRRPGRTGLFAVDLAPGRYAVLCNLVDKDGTAHSLKGMAVDLEVRAEAEGGPTGTTTTSGG